jgi:restriction endonuclease-like protein
MAAVLAAGRGAALSHRSAASLWRVRPTTRPLIEVTVDRQLSRRGIEAHRGELARDEVTTVLGIPVTTLPRTLLDLAAVLARRDVERAVEEAEVLRLSDALSLVDLVARHSGRRGVATIRAILAAKRVGSSATRSELEERFLAFVERVGLPPPEVNASVQVRGRSIECDCVWRTWRLIVELDGHAFHATAAAFERDRARDRALHAGGWRVVRITWRQLHHDAAALAADLFGLLEADGYAS